jgi:putative nucleotidyltransferase with HDIG domain
MFVEEIESDKCARPHARFMISGPKDLQRVMGSRTMSAIIDTSKGLDIQHPGVALSPSDPARFEHELHSRFSAKEVAEARATVAIVAPMITEMLAPARTSTLDLRCASAAVAELMNSATGNVAALISLARLKRADETTFLHSLSVSVLMVTLGRVLGMDEGEVRELGLGGLVHDIGKAAIPADVLNKAGALTADEFAIIKNHAELGYEMLKLVDHIPASVLDICRYHHEKIDGSGYPHHLKSNAIPYNARIAAICDVYDALTTIRPYKTAWTPWQAVDWMMTSKGHFDRALLKTFVSRIVLNGLIG